MWRCAEVCLASGAKVLLFILSFLLGVEILSLLVCLMQEKGNIKGLRKGGRWQNMTGGRWEEDRTPNCARLVCVFIAAQRNPPLYWPKTEGPKCQLLGGNSRLISAFKSKHRELIQDREGRAGLQAKTCTETGGGTRGIRGQHVWDNVWGCADILSPWQNKLMVFSLHGRWDLRLCLKCSHSDEREHSEFWS